MADNKIEFLVTMKDEATRTLNSIKGNLTSLPGLMGAAFAGGAIKNFINEANQAAIAQAKVVAVIKSTGGVSGMSARGVDDLATSLSKVTAFEDDAIKSAEAMLLTFTKIGKDTFPTATETALNMSAALGQDLQSSAIQLGKALNEPIQGVTALRRVGVQLTDEQEKSIKKFMEQNDIASAQKIILQELQTEFGGMARALADTPAGKMQQVANEIGNVKEALGGILNNIIVPLIPAIKVVIELLGPTMQLVLNGLQIGFRNIFMVMIAPFALAEKGLNLLGISSSKFFQGLEAAGYNATVKNLENMKGIVTGAEQAAEAISGLGRGGGGDNGAGATNLMSENIKNLRSELDLLNPGTDAYIAKLRELNIAQNEYNHLVALSNLAIRGYDGHVATLTKTNGFALKSAKEINAELKAYGGLVKVVETPTISLSQTMKNLAADTDAAAQIMMLAYQGIAQGIQGAFRNSEGGLKGALKTTLNIVITAVEGLITAAAAAGAAFSILTFGTSTFKDAALLIAAISSLELARGIVNRFHQGGTVGDFSQQPASREFPVMVRGGETVRTEGQERDLQNRKSGSGGVVNINFNSPVSDSQFVVNSIKKALRETGLTIDKLAVNNRSKIVLA